MILSKKPEVPNEQCEHSHLKFDQGMLYLVCKKCNYVWAAVGHCKLKIMQDIMARTRTPKQPGRQDPGAVINLI